MKNTSYARQKKLIVFLFIVCTLFAFSSLYYALAASRGAEREKLTNEKAISSLCESLDSISTSLKKSLYTSDSQALLEAGNELCRQSASAKESLSLLSADRELGGEIYRFLSQVGNYTVAVALSDKEMTEAQTESLRAPYSYAEKLSEGFNGICYDYYNGDVSFPEAISSLEKNTDAPPADLYGRMTDTAQTLTDYPTLVYDGPFADEREGQKGTFLKDKDEITAEEAQKRAAELLGVKKNSLRREESIHSELELYCFSHGKTDITVTKKGGYICSVLSDAYAFEETISAGEAVKRGKEYLEKLGYEGMKSTYYSTYDGICTVNYAYEDEGIICYPDLIKVSVSLDSGKLVAFDAKQFLLSHKQRKAVKQITSDKKAREKIKASLTVLETRPAFIPLDSGKEALCHELHCRDKEGQEALIYLDAYTLRQQDILILLYSDGGILTK